jgi:hypothetical protein
MGLLKDGGIDVADGELANIQDVFEGMSLGGIGSVDKTNQGGIGTQVSDRAENRKIGVAAFIDGADQ